MLVVAKDSKSSFAILEHFVSLCENWLGDLGEWFYGDISKLKCVSFGEEKAQQGTDDYGPRLISSNEGLFNRNEMTIASGTQGKYAKRRVAQWKKRKTVVDEVHPFLITMMWFGGAE